MSSVQWQISVISDSEDLTEVSLRDALSVPELWQNTEQECDLNWKQSIANQEQQSSRYNCNSLLGKLYNSISDLTSMEDKAVSSSFSTSASDDISNYVSAGAPTSYEKEYPLHWYVWHNDLKNLKLEFLKHDVSLKK